jgi:nanoRNase/pAp phosphatase (c-di-AMP/oligoRNAs hydrolase)
MVDHKLLSRIERPDLPADYFRVFAEALARTAVYGKASVSYLGELKFPEAIAEFADLLLQLEGLEWVFCCGSFRGDVFFSIRMRNAKGDSGELARTLVAGLGRAGGHEEMAGGKVNVVTGNAEDMAKELKKRFLAELGVSRKTAKPLY